MGNKFIISFLSIFCFANTALFAQNFSAGEYDKALWMTTRFYGAQRSTDINHAELQSNWVIQDYLPSGVDASKKGISFAQDSDAGHDLTGGWFDCGDHVFFGQTGFYSGYMLLKAYDAFSTGFDDYYDEKYSGYRNSGDYSWEGGKGIPNGIPDVLDEVKHQTDLFIKMAKNSTTFYFEKGHGDWDHQERVTSVKMQTNSQGMGGEPRPMWKNPNDASMPAMCSATLALMSRVYRKYDPAYADLCLQHAKYAYDYAITKSGVVGAASGGFYSGNDNWKNGKGIMLAEMFMATGQATYKTQAYAMNTGSGNDGDVHPNAGYTFDYSNTGEIALFALAEINHPTARNHFYQRIENSFIAGTNYNGQGVYKNGGGWGKLRYVGNAALMVALYDKMKGNASLTNRVYSNVDYILGANSQKQSYIVGYRPDNSYKTPTQAHHRNAYLYDGNNNNAVITLPIKNQQFGALVGGALDGSYNNLWTDYVNTEVCVDYNVGIVGALAAIKEKLAPVDTNKFGNTTPDLGPDQSICGVSSITLDANVPVDNKKTFTWKKDDAVIHTASTTRRTISVNSAGKYTVVLDSAGEWQTTSVVNILGVLPDVSLGTDKELCKPATAELTTSVSGAGIQYTWKKNNQVLEGANTNSYTAYSVGTYKLEISATGCPTKSDEVVVTSKLPTVTHDTICKAGVANLAVVGAGPYEWYATESSTAVLKTGNTYSPTISSSTIYYVENAGSIAATAGPKASSNTLSETQNGGSIGINFTAMKAFTITQLSVHPLIFNCPGDDVSVIFTLEKDGVLQGTYTANSVACTGTQTTTPFKAYTLTFNTPVAIDGSGNYTLKPSAGSQLIWYQSGADYNQMDVAGVIDITGDTRNDKPSSFPGIFDLKIQSGSGCDRTPVLAVIDSEADCGPVTSIYDNLNTESFIGVYPNPSAEYFTLKAMNLVGENEVRVFDDLGRMVEQFNANSTQVFGKNLSTGMYHVIIYQDGKVLKSINVVKK
jgi:hypothetical protein